MDSLFIIIFLLSPLGLVIGLIKPSLFSKIFKKVPSRKLITGMFVGLATLSLIGFAITSKPSDAQESQKPEAASQENQKQEQNETEVKGETATGEGADQEQEVTDTTALITRVIDGDTVEIESGQKVRYIGIDTPETSHPDKPVQCFGVESSNKNKELVLGKEVRLEKDVSETDRYGRLLRYVWLGDQMINETLVQEGYAQSSSYPPDIKYQDRFIEAQRVAREQNKGLWESCAFFGEASKTTSAPVTTTETKTTDCNIKGNISYSTGERIYHVSGCGSYEKTQIDESKGERWFCSESEAVSAGWRKAKNCP